MLLVWVGCYQFITEVLQERDELMKGLGVQVELRGNMKSILFGSLENETGHWSSFGGKRKLSL